FKNFSRMDMQKNDLQRRKRMKWIQRDKRQKMDLQLESLPPIFTVPSISPPPFQPVLALYISLWLHTVSDEERLEISSPSMAFPSSIFFQPLTFFQLCPT
uniref:Uncharacterized protein n=1 Tax=Nothoprocta perdicaria TaxID=30464 RepID=A0A8C7EC56_NOTPE